MMQWLKMVVLLVGFLLVVAAGLGTTEQRMFLEELTVAQSAVENPLHQASIACNRFLQSAARTVLDGVQSLLD